MDGWVGAVALAIAMGEFFLLLGVYVRKAWAETEMERLKAELRKSQEARLRLVKQSVIAGTGMLYTVALGLPDCESTEAPQPETVEQAKTVNEEVRRLL